MAITQRPFREVRQRYAETHEQLGMVFDQWLDYSRQLESEGDSAEDLGDAIEALHSLFTFLPNPRRFPEAVREIPVQLPYALTKEELILDPGDEDLDRVMEHHPMDYLVNSVSWNDDEAMEIIFRGAVVLKTALGDKAAFSQCLATAVVWYAG